MKNFINDYVAYWFKNIWMLIKDGSWNAWIDKLIILGLLAFTGVLIYLSKTRNFSPFIEAPRLTFLYFYGIVLLLWALPNYYAYVKHYYGGKKQYKEHKRIEKMIKKRDAGPKRY